MSNDPSESHTLLDLSGERPLETPAPAGGPPAGLATGVAPSPPPSLDDTPSLDTMSSLDASPPVDTWPPRAAGSAPDAPLETVRADALGGQGSVIEMHRRIAMRLLREGSAVQAFQELVRASRVVPMNARLASTLTLLALHAKTFGPALTLLTQGLDETDGDERVGVMRHLVRLARRTGDLERSREVLALLLAERPNDRRARALLNALLDREERWEELDASLEKETRSALKRGALVTASRLTLRRARLWDSRLEDHARAALRYMQAAQYAEQANDGDRAFLLRLLWLRALHRADAPARSLDDAVRVVLAAGEQVGQSERARALVEELGLGRHRTRTSTSAETSPALPVVSEPPRRNSTQLELVAVAEAAARAGQRSEAAAVLAVAVQEGPDPVAARKLEALHVQRGAWRELAGLYRDLVSRSPRGPERAAWAEKLAELLESELDDARGAAAAWAEVVASTGDPRAVSEQVRLLATGKDAQGVREALDAGVHRAQSSPEKAAALVLRADEALTRREVAAATADFELALQLVPDHPAASAGLAELSATAPDDAPLHAFERALGAMPRHARGRGDLYRRLARLAEARLDPALARQAWAEVQAELPGDAEATARALSLSRAAADDGRLEQQLVALIASEPRGPGARLSRLELVALLDRQGRSDDALAALKDAVKMEPGHREAWLAYAERLIALGTRDAEAAWSLEHAATATGDSAERAEAWRRLARFVRERLGDDEKAAGFEKRAERISAELAQRASGGAPLALRPPLKPDEPSAADPKRPGEPVGPPPAPVLVARPGPRREARAPVDASREPTALVPAPAPEPFFEPGAAAPRPPPSRVEPARPIPLRQGASDDVGQLAPTSPSPAERAPQAEAPARPPVAPPPPRPPSLPPVDVQPARPVVAPLPARPVVAPPVLHPVDVSPVRPPGAPPLRPPAVAPTVLPVAEGQSAAPRREPERAIVDQPVVAHEALDDGGAAGPALVPEPLLIPPVPRRTARASVEEASALPELRRDVPGARVPQPHEADRRPPILAPVEPPPAPPADELTLPLPGGPLVIPPRRGRPPAPPPEDDFEAVAAVLEARVEPEVPSRRHARIPERNVRQLAEAFPPAPPVITRSDEREEEPASGVQEVLSADLEVPSLELAAPPDEARDEPGTLELPVELALGDPAASLPPSFGPSPSKALGVERAALFERVRNAPLDPEGYRLLADHFDTANDAARSSLMLELARALEGDPHAAPRTPRLILNVGDRAGLRHPSLRREEGELMGLVGLALCALNPARGRDAGTDEEFHLEAGKGARSAANALLAAVRILGLRSPDVFLSEDSGPPFALVYAGAPRLLVGRLAIRRELDDAELRFFAGRALFTQLPELMVLRNLRRDQLLRGLALVSQVARGKLDSAEAHVVRDAISQRSWERVRELTRTVAPTIDVAKLADGARSAANRAGLVVCGGVAPAIAALRAKKALPAETIELVRFAASERYLQLRGRVLTRR